MTTIHQDRVLPAIANDPATEGFLASARQGQFRLRCCTACKAPHWYPRPICPFCQGIPKLQQICTKVGKIKTEKKTNKNLIIATPLLLFLVCLGLWWYSGGNQSNPDYSLLNRHQAAVAINEGKFSF